MDYYDEWLGKILDKLARVYDIRIECVWNGNLYAYEITAKLDPFKNSVLIPFQQIKDYPEDYMTLNIEEHVIWPIIRRHKHYLYERRECIKVEGV